MTYKRKEIIGDCTLYLGDCLDVMPTLGKVDAVVTDPPYGIGETNKKNLSRGNLAKPTDYGEYDWDNQICPEGVNLAILKSKKQIIWGGQFYDLPSTSCKLIWDKKNGNNDLADCEIAWTNLQGANRIIRHLWNGMLRGGDERGIKRQHPTQKPLHVMKWCLRKIPDCETILDPFMGSGTTGVACAQLGHKFIGIDKTPDYFDIALKRIEEAYKQPDLFIPQPEKLKQAEMEGI